MHTCISPINTSVFQDIALDTPNIMSYRQNKRLIRRQFIKLRAGIQYYRYIFPFGDLYAKHSNGIIFPIHNNTDEILLASYLIHKNSIITSDPSINNETINILNQCMCSAYDKLTEDDISRVFKIWNSVKGVSHRYKLSNRQVSIRLVPVVTIKSNMDDYKQALLLHKLQEYIFIKLQHNPKYTELYNIDTATIFAHNKNLRYSLSDIHNLLSHFHDLNEQFKALHTSYTNALISKINTLEELIYNEIEIIKQGDRLYKMLKITGLTQEEFISELNNIQVHMRIDCIFAPYHVHRLKTSWLSSILSIQYPIRYYITNTLKYFTNIFFKPYSNNIDYDPEFNKELWYLFDYHNNNIIHIINLNTPYLVY